MLDLIGITATFSGPISNNGAYNFIDCRKFELAKWRCHCLRERYLHVGILDESILGRVQLFEMNTGLF